ncbi:MAG TPA: LPS export ABC transporter permease LptG [Candidatus Deferrimicrobiaceae bacterium]|jgi:lipopolysaccharide export system permease protein
MTILQRYLFRELAKTILLCSFGFVMLFLVIDFVDKADDFLKHGAAAREIALYYLATAPSVFVQISPVAVLVAVLVTISLRARSNELTAMFAGGLSLPRVCAPILIGCTLVSLLSFGFSELLIPRASRAAREVSRARVQPGKVAAQFSMNRYWIRGEGAILSAQLVDSRARTLSGFQYLGITPDFRLIRRIEATTATFGKDGRWHLDNGIERTETGGFVPVPFARETFSFPDTIQGFVDGETPPAEMTWSQLSAYVADLRAKGYDVHQYAVDLNAKLAYPLLNIIVSLIAIPFALSAPRSGGVWRSIGIGLLVGFFCWITLSLSLSVGRKGLLPPFVAAWAPGFLFASAGLLLFRHARR